MTLPECLPLNIVISVLVLGLTCILLSLWRRNKDLPPGPWGLPFFGYYLFLSSKLYLDFAQLAKRYGDVFCFRSAGGTLFIVLHGTKRIKDILITRSEEFIGRPVVSNLLDWISDGYGVTQEEGQPWKEHRRYFIQTVKNFGFGRLEGEGTIQEEIKILKEDIKRTKGQPTDFSFHVAYAVNSVITQIMFARKLDKHGEIFPKLAKAVHDLIDIFADNRFMLVGLPFRLAMRVLPWSTKTRRGKSFLQNTVKDIIDDHVRSFDPNNLRDYVDSYLFEMEKLRKTGELNKSSFTMERLLGISMNMMMEGTESVADTICGLLNEASKHPEEQRKVQEEMDNVLGREILPSWLDRKRLPYLDAFIQELFRTAQAFYITTHYSNFEETTIQGYRIPKRSILVGNLWSINNDPEIYPDPSKFDTKRFLGEDGKKIKSDGPYPFSIGKRDCVGQSLAQMEVFLIISSVLQSFTLQPTDKKGILRAISRD